MNPLPIALIALVGLAFTVPVQADHGCNGTITQVDAAGETFYLDDRSIRPGQVEQWLYRERNGLEGLQSGDVVNLLPESIEPSFHDPCFHLNHDTAIIMVVS